MISTEHLAKDIQDLKNKLESLHKYRYNLLLLQKEALEGFLMGVVTPKELQLALSISCLPYALDTELKQFSAILEKK